LIYSGIDDIKILLIHEKKEIGMIIGLTGKNASGKGVVAEYLKERSFYYYSLSDVIREEIKKRGAEITRETLIRVGNELRMNNGAAVLAERILPRLENDRNYIVDSIRHPAEVEVLRKNGNFRLLNIEAPEEIRFRRIKERKRESDPQTIEEFLLLEKKEVSNPESMKQQIEKCQELADFTIVNRGTLEELHKEVNKIVREALMNFKRPNWDEYFMNIAKVVSSRSNCIKRKTAAIVVKDKRIVSTGYNGTPRGTKNCNEGGCPRCNDLTSHGTKLEECYCSHAEENAITQAAYHGISLKGSTLYTTFAPCLMCTKMIINAGIEEVVYNMNYPLNDSSFKLLKEAGVMIRQCTM
jgi:dCMP deaminase